MSKMLIIQANQINKILFLFSIKKLFKLSLYKSVILLSLFLISCSNNLINAKEIKPSDQQCGNTPEELFKNEKNFIKKGDENFYNVLKKIDLDYINRGFNLIVMSDLKFSSGYSFKIKNIKKKDDIFYINFSIIDPPKNSKVLPSHSYYYCLLKIENLNKLKLIIN